MLISNITFNVEYLWKTDRTFSFHLKKHEENRNEFLKLHFHHLAAHKLKLSKSFILH